MEFEAYTTEGYEYNDPGDLDGDYMNLDDVLQEELERRAFYINQPLLAL